jgi:hypothetical protein
MMLSSSEERRSGGVQGGEVFVAVDDGFGVDLEELLRASLGRAAAGSCTASSPSTAPPSRCAGSVSPTTVLLPSTLRCRRLLPASTRCHASDGRASWEDTGRRENTTERALRPALPSFPPR